MKPDTSRGERLPDPFERFDDGDVEALIGAYPLAWVHARDAEGAASLLPLVGVYDQDGRLTELIGHMARSNPLYAALSAAPQALVLFRGPDAYISPSFAGESDWAPTWNYAHLVIRAEVRFDASETEQALRVLLDAMEGGRRQPWSPAQLGARYQALLGAIIGFRARVIELKGRFKLGQDERPEICRSITLNVPDPAMQSWMRRFNKGRA